MRQSAAVMVLDHLPDEDEVEELALMHLEDFDAEEASATADIVYEAPEWLDVSEQDQINAFMRDGAECVLVIYMSDEPDEDADLEYEDEEEE